MRRMATLLTVMFALCVSVGHAQRTVTGKVTEATTGDPLPGVAVLEKGTRNGTSTDPEGNFSITLTQEPSILVFQAIGKENKELPVGEEDFISVALEESAAELEEVVITALGAEREKRGLGYTTTSIDAEEITKGGDRSALNALQGKVPGVNITEASGNPGGSSRIIIRGFQSPTQGNQPLIVVDGVPIFNNSASTGQGDAALLNNAFDFGNGLNSINPEDIENISVLKGASATALYGSRAANGVLLITTKKGRGFAKDKPAFGISYSGNISFLSPLRLPEFQNTFGQGWDGTHLLAENGSWGPKFDGEERVWGNVVDNSQLLKPYVALEDNVEDFFETGMTVQNSFSFSGGTQDANFYVSFSNVNTDGIYPTNVDSYNRNTIALRGTRKSGIFTFSGSFNLTDSDVSQVPTGQGPTVYNSIMQIPRDVSIVDMEDYTNKFYNINNFFTPYGIVNPYFTLNEFGSKFQGSKYFGGIDAIAEITSWSNLHYRFGFDYSTDRFNIWQAVIDADTLTPNNQTSTEDPGSVRERLFTQRQLNHDLMYNLNFQLTNDLGFDALIGANLNERKRNELDLFVSELSIPGFYDLTNSSNQPGPPPGLSSPESELLRRYAGIYTQLNFDFRNYLFLNLTARNDWSSTLPEANNSYFYYGGNASIVFTDLFDITSRYFNYGKLRVGYGTTGNDAPPYTTLNTYGQASVYQPFREYTFPVAGVNAFGRGNRLPNPGLQPEITTEFEIGGELRFFTGRLTLDLTYYNRVTTDLILDVPIPAESGFTRQIQNIGEIQNKGIEALLHLDILRGDDLAGVRWGVSLNYTHNRNELLQLTDGVEEIVLGGLSTIGFIAIPGEPMGVFEGSVPLRSPEGKVVVDRFGVPIGSTEKEVFGNSQYNYILGLTNRLSWKGISLEATFDIRQGGLMYSRTADITYFTGNGVKTLYNDRKPFVVPNSVQRVERPDGGFDYLENTTAVDQGHMDDYHRATAFDRDRIIDKSFVKFREVSLGYQVPEKWIQNWPVQGLSVSVFGRNLFLWTPEDNQFVDPEITTFGNDIAADFGEFSANPSTRSFGFGLRASF